LSTRPKKAAPSRLLARACLGVAASLIAFAATAAQATDKPAARTSAAHAASLVIERAPAWVVPVKEGSTAELPKAPLQLTLVDRQTRVADRDVVRFVHAVRVINEAAGLEPGAQLEIEFDPTYERLAMHSLAIWRGAQRIDKLNARQFKFLQRETQLERRMYDGRVTASIVLDDVRVGDRVEWSYTLHGDNPVFNGKYVENEWALSSGGPLALFQFRLLAPRQRVIRQRIPAQGFQVSTQPSGRNGEWTETIVRRRAVPQFQFDPYTPGSAHLGERIEFSEFADWSDVAAWASQLFASSHASNREVAELARSLVQPGMTDEAKARRAIEFVQTDIRYFGTEMGASSHLPAAPAAVLAQRFGDCKDKVSLLIALLEAMGLNAQPVLVSTYLRGEVGALLPSPLAFNHAIARVTLDGKSYWIDGTRSYQRGPLAARQSTGLGRGLVAVAGTSELATLPSSEQVLRVSTKDVVHVASFIDDPVMDSSVTYYGDAAESIRASLASMPAAEFERQFLEEYSRAYPGVVLDGGLKAEDVEQDNAVRITARMTLPNHWQFHEQKTLAAEVALLSTLQALRLPSQAPRTQPYQGHAPGLYRHSIDYRFDQPVFTRSSNSHEDDANEQFELHTRFDGTPEHQSMEAEVAVRDVSVPVAQWPAYRDSVRKAMRSLSGTLSIGTLGTARVEQLKGQLVKLEVDLVTGKVKAVTDYQKESRARVLTLSAQLDEGRLPKPARSEVLVQRGIRLDALGQLKRAQSDFEEAVALDPRSASAHAALAVNALMRGDEDRSVEEAGSALQIASSTVRAHYTRAYANFYRRQFEPARQELIELLRDKSEADRGYGALWLYLATSGAGANAREAIQTYMPGAEKPAWPYPVLQYFSGARDFASTLAAASQGGKPDPGRLCELYFFAAQKRLLEGDAAGARQFFEKAVGTGVTEFTEYGLAKRELERIDQTATAASSYRP